MSDSASVKYSISITPPAVLLFLLFLGLKLGGVIGWSWWWVTAPLWIPFAGVIGVMLVMIVVAAVFGFLNAAFNRRHR